MRRQSTKRAPQRDDSSWNAIVSSGPKPFQSRSQHEEFINSTILLLVVPDPIFFDRSDG